MKWRLSEYFGIAMYFCGGMILYHIALGSICSAWFEKQSTQMDVAFVPVAVWAIGMAVSGLLAIVMLAAEIRLERIQKIDESEIIF